MATGPMFGVYMYIVVIVMTLGRISPEGTGGCRLQAPCHCVLENGQYLDLTHLGRKDGQAAFANVSDPHEMSYSWNPCYVYTSLCQDQAVAVCATRPAFPKDIYLDIGRHNSSRFETDPDHPNILQLTYDSKSSGTTPVRISRISLVCDENANSTFTVLGPKQQTSLIYEFELRGRSACPQGQPVSTTTAKPSTSSNTYIIIAVVSAVVVVAVVVTTVVLKRKGVICKRQNYENFE